MIGAIVDDLAPKAGAEVLLLVNGFGGTPAMELYVMANSARQLLEKAGLKVVRQLVGNYVTSLEMSGCSLTVTEFTPQTLALWDAPVKTAALNW